MKEVTEAEFNARREESRRRREEKEREAKTRADSDDLYERVGPQMYSDLTSTAGMRPTVRRAIVAGLSLSSEELLRCRDKGELRFAEMADECLEEFIKEVTEEV